MPNVRKPKRWSRKLWPNQVCPQSVEKVTDVMKIAGYGVLGTPAVVVDGEVKSVGKIPSKEDIKSWIGK